MQNLAKSPQSAQIALRPLKIHPKRPKSFPKPSKIPPKTLPKPPRKSPLVSPYQIFGRQAPKSTDSTPETCFAQIPSSKKI